MSTRVVACGFSHASGRAKTPPHKPYDMANLSYLKSLRDFQNEFGAGFGFGFNSDRDAQLQVKKTPETIKKLEAIPYPALVELVLEAHPDDPLKNIVVDVNVVYSIWDIETKTK